VPVSVSQNIELFTHALRGITITSIPDRQPKYQTVQLNTGHLATLNVKRFHGIIFSVFLLLTIENILCTNQETDLAR